MRILWLLHADRTRGRSNELFGHRVPDALRKSLLAIDTCAAPAPKTERVAIVTERTRSSYQRLRMALAAKGVPATLRVVKDDAATGNAEQRDRALLSNAILVEIVNQVGPGAN